MTRTFAAAALLVSVCACTGLPSVTSDPDYALCERAREQALRGDPAAEQTLDGMRDLRFASYCKNDLMVRDRLLPPNGT